MKSGSKYFSSRFSLYALLLLAIIFVFVKIRQVNGEPKFIPESYAISWDGYGYYLHLPATIIHHDPGMKDRNWINSLNTKYQPGRPFYQANAGIENKLVNVYTTGTAIAWLPFFLAGHAYAGIAGYPQDGLSPPYQYAIMIAGLFYAIFGLVLLRILLLKFVNDKTAAIVLLITGLGTNLYMYATYENTITHIILFALDTLIVLLTIAWHEHPKRKTAFILGLILGLSTIIRPTEIIWILIPLFWNVSGFRSLKEKFRFFIAHFSHLLIFILGAAIFGSIQLAYWKFTSGNWIANNHAEGFDFFNPFLTKVLFSYKKGWLLYTPIMIFAIAGIFLQLRDNRKLFVPVFLFFIFNLWIVSSWECWWYAGSFSQRAMVQSYGLLAVPLALLIERFAFKRLFKIWLGTVLVFFTLLNQFQSWQHTAGVLSGELMTKEYYWKVFGQTKVQPEWNKLLEVDRSNLPPFEEVAADYQVIPLSKMDFELTESKDPVLICDTFGFQSNRSLVMDKQHDYATPFEKPFEEISSSDHLRLRMSADVFVPENYANNDLIFVFNMIGSRDQQYGMMSVGFDTSQIHPGKWSHVQADFITPHLLHTSDRLHFMSWNPGGKMILIDNVAMVGYVK